MEILLLTNKVKNVEIDIFLQSRFRRFYAPRGLDLEVFYAPIGLDLDGFMHSEV